MNQKRIKAVQQGLIVCGIGFLLLFLFRFGFEFNRPAYSLSNYSNVYSGWDRFEYKVKNVASSKMVLQEGGHSYNVDQKYQKIADINTSSNNFEKDEQKIRSAITKYKALIQFENNSGLPGTRSLQMAIGVPPHEFDNIIPELKKIGHLQSLNINKVDKTNEFKELKGKRQSLEQTRSALLALKLKGGKIDEFVNLENRILEIEEQIQNLGVQLGDYDATNEFCTVKVSLIEKALQIKSSVAQKIVSALEWTFKYYFLFILTMFIAGLTILIGLTALEKLKSVFEIGGKSASSK